MNVLSKLLGPKKPLTTEQKINELKARLRSAVLDYRAASDGFGGNGGAHIMAVIRPDIALKAKKVNALADELRQIDPTFPKTWKPYATGDN